MGSYKYYQFKIREEMANEDIIQIVDNLLIALHKQGRVRFYDDEDCEVSLETGLNVVI